MLRASAFSFLIFMPLFLTSCSEDALFGTGGAAKASVNTPAGAQTGDVPIIYSLKGNTTPTDISVSYSLDGVIFRTATSSASGEGSQGLSVSTAGDVHTFVWASGTDVKSERQSSVFLRLRPDGGSSVKTGSISVHNGRFLTAVENRAAGRIRLYFLSAIDGSLRFIRSADTGGTDPYDVLFQDSYIFVAHTTSSQVAAFKLDQANETLTAVPGSPFPSNGVGSKYLACDGTRLFVSNATGGTITIFDYDSATGRLSLNINSGVSAPGCRALAVRSGELYVASESGGSILIFDIGGDGSLTESGASPVSTGGLSSPRAVTISTNRLYAANASAASLCGFSFLAGGGLSPLSGSPFTLSSVGAEDIAANGSKLFCVTGSGATLISSTLSALGAPSADAGSPFTLPGPSFGARSAGSVVIAATTTSQLFQIYTIDASGTVALAPTSQVSAGGEILRIAVSD